MDEQGKTVQFSSGELKATGKPRVRVGVIFAAGSYPDKKTVISDADLVEIAANSTGEIPVDINHSDSVFDGRLGCFTRIWAAGSNLMGEWHEPAPLTALLGDAARKVSVQLNRSLKKIEKVSLVLTPRVASAIVFSADAVSVPGGGITLTNAPVDSVAVVTEMQSKCFSRPDRADEKIDWVQVNLARKEAGLPARK